MTFICLSCNTQEENKKKGTETDDISLLAALPYEPIYPENNPASKDKIQLGKLLFFDPILSGNKDVACATCHHPEFGFAESLEISIGVNGEGLGSKRHFKNPDLIPFVKRNSQTIVNTAYNGFTNSGEMLPENAPMFWDLRAYSLEKQAIEPIKTLEEMRGKSFSEETILIEVIDRLSKIQGYVQLFQLVFSEQYPINIQNMAKAIAAYERSIISNNSRFDQYMRGDESILSTNEKLGLAAFLKSGCTKCHNGPMFSDFRTHILGVDDNEKLGFSDEGFENNYAFRTPTLRNLRFTSPYMHNGKIKTLTQVLEFYEDLSGGKIKNNKVKQVDPLIDNLKVNFKDISLIVEFLNTLNDDSFDKTIPENVPSGLKVGGDI